jgi:hypothetical protein
MSRYHYTRRTDENMKRALAIALIIGFLICAFTSSAESQGSDPTRKIVIKVSPGIISLTKGRIARVSIGSARIRSDELKELNKRYNAVTIEKIFKKETRGSGEGGGLVGKERDSGNIDLNSIFTKETRDEMEKEGGAVAQLEDTFLIELTTADEISQILSDYGALEEVLDVRAVTVKRE